MSYLAGAVVWAGNAFFIFSFSFSPILLEKEEDIFWWWSVYHGKHGIGEVFFLYSIIALCSSLLSCVWGMGRRGLGLGNGNGQTFMYS